MDTEFLLWEWYGSVVYLESSENVSTQFSGGKVVTRPLCIIGINIKCCDFIVCDRGRRFADLESMSPPNGLTIMDHASSRVQSSEVSRPLPGVMLWGQPVWSTRHVGVMELFSL
jgi:hypothetical protein